MENPIDHLIEKAYLAFNNRDIPKALTTFHKNVQWPKAFEGGYVKGHDEIKKYWTKQWTEINPSVSPIGILERSVGVYEVTVHQLVKDLNGTILFDGVIKHVYTVNDHLLAKMDIEF